MDIFDLKELKPMLIGESKDAFDSPDYIYELKLDGERILAYLDTGSTELRNKRNLKMLPKVPELSDIHKQIKCSRCILDGELIILKDGKPDFFEIQRRSLMSNSFKIQIASSVLPATFTAFDILYIDSEEINSLPLMQRKEILKNAFVENERLALSRYIENEGTAFFELSKKLGLEGIVAKRKDSKYYFGKHTKEWIKIKNLEDDDYVVCGYIEKGANAASIILGKYDEEKLIYMGHVTLGVSSLDMNAIRKTKTIKEPEFDMPKGNESAVWLEPKLVCTVKYMMKTQSGSLRQPVFKGLRFDKEPKECIVKKT